MSWFRSSRRRRSDPLEAESPPEQEVAGEAAAPAEEGAQVDDRPPRSDVAVAPLADLHALAREQGIAGYRLLRREELIQAVSSDGADMPAAPPPERVPEIEIEEPADEDEVDAEQGVGVLDIAGEGFGFVRGASLVRSDDDPFISRTQVRRLGLRAGDLVAGVVRPPRRGENHPSMVRVTSVNGAEAGEEASERPVFEDLQIDRPDTVLRLELESGDLAGRMIDLVAPIGRGHRGLVAGPPAAGASRLLRGAAVALAGGESQVIAVLCDVRPEEMLDWEATDGLEVNAATAEQPPEAHRRMADLALEHAKRLAESGRDVIVLLDSATRLARAHSLAAPGSADPSDPEAAPDGAAVHAVKRWFASARNTREAGSLTILAAVRTDSESRLDAAVYESLADVANLELRLDAGLAAAGHHPALDLTRSRTLHEEGLIDESASRRVELLRGVVRSLDTEEAWRFLAGKVGETGSNQELLAEQA